MAQVERFPGLVRRSGDENGDLYWHLRDDNGEIIVAGEGHPSPAKIQRAVNNVAREFAILYMNAADGKHLDVAALDNFEDWPVIDIPITDTSSKSEAQ